MVIYKAVDIVRRSEGFFLFRAIILNCASIPKKLVTQCKFFFFYHTCKSWKSGEGTHGSKLLYFHVFSFPSLNPSSHFCQKLTAEQNCTHKYRCGSFFLYLFCCLTVDHMQFGVPL